MYEVHEGPGGIVSLHATGARSPLALFDSVKKQLESRGLLELSRRSVERAFPYMAADSEPYDMETLAYNVQGVLEDGQRPATFEDWVNAIASEFEANLRSVLDKPRWWVAVRGPASPVSSVPASEADMVKMRVHVGETREEPTLWSTAPDSPSSNYEYLFGFLEKSDRDAFQQILQHAPIEEARAASRNAMADGNVVKIKGAPAGSGRAEPASTSKVSRNDACPCGSGKKFKKCCGA